MLRQMKQLLTLFRGSMDEELRPHGATTAQVQLLYQIQQAETCTGAKLARAMNVTPQTSQALLSRSEREGWVQRGRDGENGRLVLWSLTADGERLLKAAEAIFDGVQTRLLRGFTAKSLGELNDLLERCLGNLER